MEKKQSREFAKTSNPTVINLQQGKIPPQALELEEAVLGAMLIDKKGVDEVIDLTGSFLQGGSSNHFRGHFPTLSRLSTHRSFDGFI